MGNLTVKESGEMASFISPNVSKITSFKVHFSPKQEGSGDPSPENIREITGWNGVEGYGCGKNLVPWIKTNFTVQGDYYNGFAGWSKLWEIPKRISYTYSVFIDNSNCNTAGGARVWLRDIDNSKYTHVVTGTKIKAGEKGISTVTLNFSNLPNDYYACWGLDLHPNAIASMPIVYESDQEKQITSDWSKNLLDTNHEIFTYTGYQRNSDGSITLNSSNGKSWTDDSNFPPLELKKGTYTISWYGITEEDSAMINLRTSVDEYVNNIRFANGNGTFTLNEDCGVKFKISASTYPVSGYIQIENGSEPTEYQPYVGDVYGGYVDLISGELVEDKAMKTFDGSETWNTATVSSKTAYQTKRPADIASGAVFTSNIITRVASLSGTVPNNVGYFGGTYLNVYAPSLSLEEWIAMLTATPLQIVYKLAEPITHQLTPTQLSTLKGQNNFWSNADYIEIEYELTETFDIQKAKRKIILNQPHVESASGDIVTFDTDMKGKLKECKVYFSPVQEGEGDPSPDNVRNITGWNGVSVYRHGMNFAITDAIYCGKLQPSTGIIKTASAYKTWCVPIPKGIIRCSKIKKPENGNINMVAMVDDIPQIGIPYYGVDGVEGSGTQLTNYTNRLVDNTAGHKYLVVFASQMFETFDEVINATNFMITLSTISIDATTNYIEPNANYKYSIDWTDSTGTVYGGYVDLASGELVKEYECKRVDTNLGAINYSTSRIRYTVADAYPINSDDSYVNFSYTCNMFPKTKSSSISGVRFTRNSEYTTAFVLFQGIDSFGIENTLEAWNDFTSSNDIYITYKLKDPIHYQLTPQQILALKGINNVYSDTNGQMEIKYWKH